MKNILIISIISILFQSYLFGFSSLYGPTGILKIPTAEVLNSKEYNFSSSLALSTNKGNSSLHTYSANLGLIQNTEFGILGSSELDEGVYLNAKWNASSYFDSIPFNSAIGVKNFPSSERFDLYLVGSKRVHKDVTIHFGNSNKIGDKIHASILLGSLYTYSEDIFFAGDISSESDNKYNLSLGVYMKIMPEKFSNNLYFKGEVLNLIKNSDEDSYISLGISYANFM